MRTPIFAEKGPGVSVPFSPLASGHGGGLPLGPGVAPLRARQSSFHSEPCWLKSGRRRRAKPLELDGFQQPFLAAARPFARNTSAASSSACAAAGRDKLFLYTCLSAYAHVDVCAVLHVHYTHIHVYNIYIYTYIYIFTLHFTYAYICNACIHML